MNEVDKYKQKLLEQFNNADSLERVEMLRKGLFAKGGNYEIKR